MVMDLCDKLYSLFKGYLHTTNNEAHNMVEEASSSGANEKVRDDDIAGFDTFESEIFGSINRKSQLDVYLEEARFDHNTHMDLDILEYWESHCGRFPELSLMAYDIMSIPITTVALESALALVVEFLISTAVVYCHKMQRLCYVPIAGYLLGRVNIFFIYL